MHRIVCALKDNVAIPLEPVALEGVDYFFGSTGLLAWRVNIFNTQQPEAIVDPCLQVACYRSNERAEMKRAGRRWREPANISVGFTDTGRRCRGIVSPTIRDVLVPQGSTSRQVELQVA